MNEYTEFEIFVEGRPAPQGSKSHVGGGRMKESSVHLPAWRQTIIDQLTDDNGVPLVRFAPDAPIAAELTFELERPKYLKPGVYKPFIKTPDIDKLQRAVLDALTLAGVWNDDAQVRDIHALKYYAEYGEPTGVSITLLGRKFSS